ncbi:hypothetical protein BHE74_00031156, partial [Ensete ventricosum]
CSGREWSGRQDTYVARPVGASRATRLLTHYIYSLSAAAQLGELLGAAQLGELLGGLRERASSDALDWRYKAWLLGAVPRLGLFPFPLSFRVQLPISVVIYPFLMLYQIYFTSLAGRLDELHKLPHRLGFYCGLHRSMVKVSLPAMLIKVNVNVNERSVVYRWSGPSGIIR